MTPKKILKSICILTVIFFSWPAFSQGIAVQSGEHSTFSRLVFLDRPNQEWEVRQRENSVDVIFSNDVPKLDFTRTFDLIPRDRLEDISVQNRTLRLGLRCDCPVEVIQIPTGHIVIDIADPIQNITLQKPTSTASSLDLKLAGLPFPIIEALLQTETEKVNQEPIPNTTIEIPANQVRRHPIGRVPLVLDDAEDPVETRHSSSCTIDAFARKILTSNPEDALSTLVSTRRFLLAGNDTLDTSVVDGLVETYLELGWGAEAVLTSTATGTVNTDVSVLAGALDGTAIPADLVVDPGCGPAAAVIALLIGVTEEDWQRANESDVVILLDMFHDLRWFNLRDRLADALRQLGRESLMAGLGPTPGEDAQQISQQPAAAGTDLKAISASIDILTSANATGSPNDSLHIENARALRPSVPDGKLRKALDLALVEALVIARHPSSTIDMLKEGQAESAQVFDLLTQHLPPEDRVDFVVRLEPILTPNDPVRIKARDFLLALGLQAAAGRFAALPSANLPNEVPKASEIREPWLDRDFAALAEVGNADWTARNRVAAAILERNRQSPPESDLAAAESTLSHSQSTGALIRSLLMNP